MLTTILLADAAVDAFTERASRSPISSYSSDEATAHARSSPFQRSPMAQQPFPAYTTNYDASQVYINSNVGVNQYSVEPSYTASTYPTSFDGNHRIPLFGPGGQTQSHTVQPPFSPMTQMDSAARSSSTPWGTPIMASHPTPSNISYGVPETLHPPYRLDYKSSPGTPYYPGNNHGIQYENSPYPSLSSEQGTSYSQSTANSYIGETEQQNNWSEQPPDKLNITRATTR